MLTYSGGKGGATAASEQHQGTGFCPGIDALHFTQNLLRFAGLVIVLHAEQSKNLVALGTELGNVAATEHFLINQDRLSLVRYEVRCEQRSEGEISAWLRFYVSPVETLNL